ncbi:hypothetical protein [Sphingomonas sp. SRS2]|uniref:hypothetical protein n=1 Tax=Sphingomonas sp. SRS2 TaxID=133190 RepID=UPI001F35AF79|nr:hypothetical protein [Sphingomonas sp. SRS2]
MRPDFAQDRRESDAHVVHRAPRQIRTATKADDPRHDQSIDSSQQLRDVVPARAEDIGRPIDDPAFMPPQISVGIFEHIRIEFGIGDKVENSANFGKRRPHFDPAKIAWDVQPQEPAIAIAIAAKPPDIGAAPIVKAGSTGAHHATLIIASKKIGDPPIGCLATLRCKTHCNP